MINERHKRTWRAYIIYIYAPYTRVVLVFIVVRKLVEKNLPPTPSFHPYELGGPVRDGRRKSPPIFPLGK